MLFKSPRLDREELGVVRQIAEMYKQMKIHLSTPARWTGTLRRDTFARAIRGSNSIEGYVVSVEDAVAAIEGDQPLNANPTSWEATTGYRNAMTYVLQLAKDPNFTMNEGFLRSLHFMILYYDLNKHPGNWRPGPVWVRDEEKGENVYEGPPWERVPSMVSELITYLCGPEDNDHILVKAAMAHLNLVMIHPFSDGNGRMARCLQSLVVAMKSGIGDPNFSSIEEYLGSGGNTRKYYDVLAEVGQGSWNPQNNVRPWIRFNLLAHYRQAATLLRRTRFIAKVWAYLEEQIKQRGLPDRAIYALGDAAMGYHVRPARYRHNAEISDVLASRDLRQLVNSGFLIPQGERRGRVYIASPTLQDAVLKIREEEPTQIPDPFTTPISEGMDKPSYLEQIKELEKDPKERMQKEQLNELIGKVGRKI
jgi:Fic family protein